MIIYNLLEEIEDDLSIITAIIKLSVEPNKDARILAKVYEIQERVVALKNLNHPQLGKGNTEP